MPALLGFREEGDRREHPRQNDERKDYPGQAREDHALGGPLVRRGRSRLHLGHLEMVTQMKIVPL
ncbi:hypothetical protein Plo01_53320 [Planobispora longispora]|uniref:Uncharacterized protein n=1 Tax=Planobispora longispora TaxID=28887 RepID=A0A8J3W7R7_9ACTN|nr:hypothetical protein Plo01_53320 [Planobispora longispora]